MESNPIVLELTEADGEWHGVPDADAGVFVVAGRYEVHFLGLWVSFMPQSGVGFDQYVLSIRYEVAPIGGTNWTAGDRAWAGNLPEGKWALEGQDDLGTRYEVQYGASGFCGPDNMIFDSTISFEPGVPVDARWIEIRFMDWHWPKQPMRTFRADLPTLPAVPVP